MRIVTNTPRPSFAEPTSRKRDLIRFLVETAAVLVALAAAVLVALPGSVVVASALTIAITGWQDPGPGIVQGCEKSLTCSEGGTFLIAWAGTLLVCVVIAVIAFRAVLVRLDRGGGTGQCR